MPELLPGFDCDKDPKQTCAVCNKTVSRWYCEVCDEWAFDCGCNDHRSEEEHRQIMAARRRPF